MILIFHGPGTTRIIPGVVAIMGVELLDERKKCRGKFIPGKPFGWFRKGSNFGFGQMPEFFEKRFTHVGVLAHPEFPTLAMKKIRGAGNLFWIVCPEDEKDDVRRDICSPERR